MYSGFAWGINLEETVLTSSTERRKKQIFKQLMKTSTITITKEKQMNDKVNAHTLEDLEKVLRTKEQEEEGKTEEVKTN